MLGYYFHIYGEATLVKKPKVGRLPQAKGFGKQSASNNKAVQEQSLRFFSLGNVLLQQGKRAEAAANFEQAGLLRPDWAEAHFHRGYALSAPWMGCFGEAIASYRRVIALRPDWPEAHCNLAELQMMVGDSHEAVASACQALTLRPDYAEAHQILLFSKQYSAELTPEDWRSTLTNFAQFRYAPITHVPHENSPDPNRRLRIGYASADFRTHSCAWFIEPLLAAHNRTHFEVICYPCGPYADAVTARLKVLVDGWHSIAGMDAEAAAERIRSHNIDILVDLSGYSFGNGLSIFHHKPAPLQVTWLGCPGSTGLEAIDYRLSDPWLTPPDTPEYFAETVWNLKRPSHCYRPAPLSPTIAPLPALKCGHITFGSFNNASKLSVEILTLWATVLQAVEGSRLVLKCWQMADPEVRRRVSGIFVECGIDESRIDFLGMLADSNEHLDAYNRIDIALDTYPYNGATTTLEALWMGVPVISLAGWRTASCYGLSFLSTLGYGEFATSTPEQFVQTARDLAADLPRLAKIRGQLREQLERSPLCDESGFAQVVEAAYHEMWNRWCSSVGSHLKAEIQSS
jgi:protein O-GlcNAc transferase